MNAPHARIESKAELAGAGCLLQLAGLGLLFWFPIGTALGLVLMIYGALRARRPICGNCRIRSIAGRSLCAPPAIPCCTNSLIIRPGHEHRRSSSGG